MLKRFITAVICAGLFNVPVLHAAAALSAEVEKLVAEVERTARIPVIVKFRKENNIIELKDIINKRHQYESRGEESRSRLKKLFRKSVLLDLREQLVEPRAKLIKTLRSHGIKTRLKSLWAINAVALTLPTELVDEIAALPEVDRITVDMRLIMSEIGSDGSTTDPLWNLININTEPLWRQGIAGEGVTVAIMDSGVELNHPDLIDKWRGGGNSWFDPYQQHELPADSAGHGTQALGIILAGDESGYQIGMAPGAKWIAAKIFDNANESTLSAIHEAFQWLLDPDGDPLTDDAPDLVNNSWGFSNTVNECFQEFSEDIQLLRESGIGVVFSAGNFGPATESSISPANDPGAFSVGSVDQANQIDLLSSRGPGACDGGVFPKIVAPGSLIFTTDLLPSAYNVVSGTSFSAPHVTGAMTLLKSAFPDATPSQIETAIIESATDLGVAGTDGDFGYGLLDVDAAYTYLENSFASSESSRIEFSEMLYSVDEETQRLIVTVRRSGGSKGEVSVDYTTLEDSARQGRDYAVSKGTLHFADGETQRSFEVVINDDSLDEENESFYLALSNVDGGATLGERSEAQVIILDNDGAGSISFAAIAYAVNESRQQAIVDVIRTQGSAGVVDMEYQLVAKSAEPDIDYVSAAGSVSFQPGETEKQIQIDLIDDDLYEGNETFQLLISAVSEGATIAEPATTTVTILDDDPDAQTVSIRLDAVSYDVGEAAGKATLAVIRSGDIEAPASVKYKTLDGSAKKRADYREIAGTLTFAAGVTRRTISIEILDDGLYEAESSFTLLLSDASGNATITTPSAAIVRIMDDDALPFVSIHSTPNRNGSPGSGFSSRGGSLKKEPRMNRSEKASGAGASLKVFDLRLSDYAAGYPPDRSLDQGSMEKPPDQASNEHAPEALAKQDGAACGSTTEVATDTGPCVSSEPEGMHSPGDSEEKQTSTAKHEEAESGSGPEAAKSTESED